MSRLCASSADSVLRYLLAILMGTSLCLGALMIVVVAAFGGVNRARAYFRGQSVFLEHANQDMGRLSLKALGVQAGQRPALPARVRLENLSSRPITVVGIHSSCGCLSSSSFPVRIDPKGTELVDFRITPKSREPPETFLHVIDFYFNVPHPPVQATIAGQWTP